MISIFNEFKSPWILKTHPRTGARLLTKKRKIDSSGKDKKSVYVQTEIHDDILSTDINIKLESLIEMSDPVILSNEKVTVTFNRKSMVPRVERMKSNKLQGRSILFLSINLRNSKIVDINSKDVMMIEGSELPGFFSGILVFNKPTSQFSLSMYDEARKTLVTQLFTIEKGKFVRDKVIDRDTDETTDTFIVKKYRPTKVTEAILVLESNVNDVKAMEFYKKAEEDYKIFTFTSLEDIQNTIDKASAEEYLAISLYVPSTNTINEVYTNIIGMYKKSFRVFYTFNEVSKVNKIKVR